MELALQAVNAAGLLHASITGRLAPFR